MTSHYVTVTKKLYLDARADEYIILCKFISHTISGYRVTCVGPLKPEKPEKRGLNRVKILTLLTRLPLIIILTLLTIQTLLTN